MRVRFSGRMGDDRNRCLLDQLSSNYGPIILFMPHWTTIMIAFICCRIITNHIELAADININKMTSPAMRGIFDLLIADCCLTVFCYVIKSRS